MAYTNMIKCIQRDAPAGMRDVLGKLAEAIQAGLIFTVCIPRFTGWTKDDTAKDVHYCGKTISFPFPVEIIYAQAGVLTAPGSGKTITIKQGSNTLGSIADTNLYFESKGSVLATVPADTALGLTITETAAGSGANCDITIICRALPPIEV